MLTIKRYDKDLHTGVLYGWDLRVAFEGADYYIFEFHHRIGDKQPVTCRIERELSDGLFDKVYKCEVFQIGANWRCSYMLQPRHIQQPVLLYELVENILENHKDSLV